jgi:hypothetical protein
VKTTADVGLLVRRGLLEQPARKEPLRGKRELVGRLRGEREVEIRPDDLGELEAGVMQAGGNIPLEQQRLQQRQAEGRTE